MIHSTRAKCLFTALIACLPFFMKAQMVGPDAYTKGTSVEYGIDGQGGFEGIDTIASPPVPGMHGRSNTQYFGFVANPQLDSWATQDGDFFTPGTPENGWGFEIGTSGIKGNNNCNPIVEVPGAITHWSHILNCYTTVWEGDATSGTDLHFKISYLLQETDLFYTTTVSVTNNTSAMIPELFYHRNLDPDNNVTITGSYTTTNTIVSQPGTGCNLAHVSATQSSPWLSYIGLAGVGPNFKVSLGGFSNRDASDLWNGIGFTQTVGAVSTADEAISLSYKIQNLAPGATATFNYVVILDNSAASNAINNLFYLNYPGSFTAPPSACTPYTDTARTCGDSVPVSVVGSIVGDFTWSWSPATGLSSTSGPAVIADPPATTTYTVTGTPLNPCYSPVTLNIVVQVTPGEGSDPVITPVPPICVTNSPISLTADTVGGVWSGPGVTSPGLGTFDPGAAGIGTHLIVYVTSGLCNTTDTMYITVGTGDDPTITQPPVMCVAGPADTLSAATPGGTWSGIGITDSLAGVFDPVTAGAGTHVITYSANGTCVSTDTVSISVVTAFNSTITPHADVCEGSASFTFTAATGGGTWTGTGITGPVTGAYNPTTAGTFPIIYTISGFCGSADTVNMTVIPNADATITAVSAVCQGSAPFNMTAADPGGTWSGTGITNAATGTYTPSAAGTFTVTYTISGLCGDTDTQPVTVNATPTPNITASVTSGCVPLCVQFNETAGTSCTNVIYNFGDASADSTSSPLHCYTQDGTYSVAITCTDANNCTGTTTITNMITVWPIPQADFVVSPSSMVDPNSPVTVTDVSTDGGFTFWNFGDPSTLSDTSTAGIASWSYAEENEYCITLVSANAGGCLDTASRCVIVVGEGIIFIPNVFSPNGDGTNDEFEVTTRGIASLTCVIYDRWGLKIAEWNGVNGSWNGETFNGGNAPDGTYFFILHATALNGRQTEKHGYLQLVNGRK